jgi:hypothetical protein
VTASLPGKKERASATEEGILQIATIARQIRNALEAVLNNTLTRWIRIVASCAGFIILLVPSIRDEVRLAAGFAAAILVLSFMADLILRDSSHFQDRVAYAIEARKYGYGYLGLTVTAYLEVKDGQGSMTSRRRVHLKTTSVQNHIRHYLQTSNEQLEGSVEVTELEQIKPKNTTVSFEKVKDLSRPSGMVIDVAFNPPLDPGEVAIYQVTEQFPPGSFAIDAQQVAQLSPKCEYFAWHIDKPTKHIHFAIRIPDYLHPAKCRHDVWYGLHSRQTHRAESERVGLFFSSESDGVYTCLQLDVEYPVLGLDYVLIWEYQ